MAEKAHVTSVDAIEEFRSHLVLYVSKARPTLEEISSDVVRMRMWLETGQRMALEGLARRRTKELEQAQAALSGARMATLRSETSTEQMAVHRAKRAVEDVEGKLKRLKHWNREFDSRVEPLARQLEKLHTFLAHDTVQALAQLSRVVETLSSYADMIAPAAGGPAIPAPNTQAGGSGGTDGSSPGGVP